MAKRTGNSIFLAALAILLLWFLLGADGLLAGMAAPDTFAATYYLSTGEDIVRGRLPFSHQLEQLGLDIRLLAGQREQGGIFIDESALMRKLDAPIEPYIKENSSAIRQFSQELAEISIQKQTYLAIIPTAAGVTEQYLPRFADSQMINQQRFIEELYGSVSDTVFTVDVYSALYSRRDQYVYYRTENNLSPLGGYYAYSAIARRLGETDRSLSQFNIEYVDHAYYGDLYQTPPSAAGWSGNTAPYRRVRPDTLSLYRYSRSAREYTVTHRGGGIQRVYHSLYPMHLLQLDAKTDVYLGGISAIVDIKSSAPTRKRLLVFGDKTAQAYLPFLANHYQQVTLVNLYQMSGADYETINPLDYDSVLFAYGIETYIHTNHIGKINRFSWEEA